MSQSMQILPVVIIVSFCTIVTMSRRLPFDVPPPPTAVTYLKCALYDKTVCLEEGQKCNGTALCEVSTDVVANCFASWTNKSGNNELFMAGCWLNNPVCSNTAECVDRDPEEDGHRFCCCSGDYCNRNFSYIPNRLPSTTISTTLSTVSEPTRDILGTTLICTMVPLVLLAVLVLAIFYFLRCRNPRYGLAIPAEDPIVLDTPPSPTNSRMQPLQLLEVKARGRFGCVWKAQLLNEIVAVKIFPIQDKQSWEAERTIYRLPLMNHKNVLKFLGSERRGDNLNMDLWLVTEFHENGSLYDYLKGNKLTWNDVCHVAETMVAGLAYIHDDAWKGDLHKPAIAHRDFKSRNILLKRDLTACIADFGLAMMFERGRVIGDTHGQVGTRRYMAPEVLEGAINFNRDSFLRIDMYACGLVLWELVSRCSAVEGTKEEYQMPFEEEVGLHPTLEDMQEWVVNKKYRPQFKESWTKHQGMQAMCETIEECWDHDAEARLSAGCIVERIAQSSLCGNNYTSSLNTNPNTPLIIDTNTQSVTEKMSSM